MAKIRMYAALGEWTWLPNLYDVGSVEGISQSGQQMLLEDSTGMQILLEGKNLKYENGDPVSGTVTTISFINEDSDLLLKYSGAKYDFGKLFKITENLEDDLYNLFSYLNAGKDRVTGSNLGDDILLHSNGGNDVIKGLGGDDFIKGSDGNNKFDGGKGWDTLSYEDARWDSQAKKGVVIAVEAGTANNPWGGKDTFKNIEDYRGTEHNDKMTGGKSDDRFMGFEGKDVFDGGKGVDSVRYDRDYRYDDGDSGIKANLAKEKIVDGFGDTDTVKNIEQVRGTDYKDTFVGDKADNRFYGFDGKDSYNGGKGTDAISFYSDHAENGINIDLTLSKNQIIDDGFGNTENAKSIEAVIGSTLDDTIKLGSTDGWVYGDTGADMIIAGTGEHYMEGAEGADTFVFLSAAASLKGTTTRDFLADFSQGDGDRIDLSAFDGISFEDNVSFNVNTDGNTIVTVDVSTDDADLQFLIKGAVSLGAGDFIFA